MTDNSAASPSGGDDSASARQIRRVASQWPIIIVCATLAAAAGYFASNSRPKAYESTTVVQLNDINLSAVVLNQNLSQQGLDAQTRTATAAKLVTMPAVRQSASTALGGRVTPRQLSHSIAVSADGNTTLISITATASSPALAVAEADAMRVAFIQDRQDAAASSLVATRTRIAQQYNAIPTAQRSGANAQSLRTQLDQLATLINTSGAGVTTAQPATAPDGPSSPRPKRSAFLALLAGGLLGLGVAALRARLDERVRDVKEVTAAWDLPILGVIPETSTLSKAGRGLPSAAAVEAFALTRANLRYLHVGGDIKTVVVTSALPEEGKSTVAWNLALASAMAGQRVLLIDADLRRPVVAERAGLSQAQGFSDVLAGLVEPLDVVAPIEVAIPNQQAVRVDVLPAGFVPPSPIALLERDGAAAVLKTLAENYQLVVIDSPPATVVADAKVLLAHADGAVVVFRLGRVTRGALRRMKEILQGLESPVLGAVVNTGAAERAYGYTSYSVRPETEQVGRFQTAPVGAASESSSK